MQLSPTTQRCQNDNSRDATDSLRRSRTRKSRLQLNIIQINHCRLLSSVGLLRSQYYSSSFEFEPASFPVSVLLRDSYSDWRYLSPPLRSFRSPSALHCHSKRDRSLVGCVLIFFRMHFCSSTRKTTNASSPPLPPIITSHRSGKAIKIDNSV